MAQGVTITNENVISLVNHDNDLDEGEENITFDTVLRHVGEFGKFQKILYLMFSVPYVETAMQLLGWVFVGTIPKHDCPLSSSGNNTNYSNITFDTTHVTSSAAMEWYLVCGNSSLYASVGAAPMVSKIKSQIEFQISTSPPQCSKWEGNIWDEILERLREF